MNKNKRFLVVITGLAALLFVSAFYLMLMRNDMHLLHSSVKLQPQPPSYMLINPVVSELPALAERTIIVRDVGYIACEYLLLNEPVGDFDEYVIMVNQYPFFINNNVSALSRVHALIGACKWKGNELLYAINVSKIKTDN